MVDHSNEFDLYKIELTDAYGEKREYRIAPNILHLLPVNTAMQMDRIKQYREIDKKFRELRDIIPYCDTGLSILMRAIDLYLEDKLNQLHGELDALGREEPK